MGYVDVSHSFNVNKVTNFSFSLLFLFSERKMNAFSHIIIKITHLYYPELLTNDIHLIWKCNTSLTIFTFLKLQYVSHINKALLNLHTEVVELF